MGLYYGCEGGKEHGGLWAVPWRAYLCKKAYREAKRLEDEKKIPADVWAHHHEAVQHTRAYRIAFRPWWIDRKQFQRRRKEERDTAP